MQVHLDGADLLEGPKKAGGELKQASVSTGAQDKTGKAQATENWSQSEKTTDQFSVYKKPEKEDKGGTIEDVMQQAENMDAAQMQKKMVVASNTTTTTDCKQAEEDGFSLDNTDIKTVVTVVDKIKMQLAKAGVDISCFGDSLSASQLEELAGGAAQARQLAGKIEQQADMPLNGDNIKDLKEAAWQAGQLHGLDDRTVKYMLENGLEPTVANLYHAQYSTGSAVYGAQAVENGGFSEADFANMEGQVLTVIALSGRADTQAAMEDSRWLLKNGAALTAENLNALKQLKELELPVEKEDLYNKMIAGMAEGRRPQDTPLVDGYLWKEQAAQAVETLEQATDGDLAYLINKKEPVTLENLQKAHNILQNGTADSQEAEAARKLAVDSANAYNAGSPEDSSGINNDGNAGRLDEINIQKSGQADNIITNSLNGKSGQTEGIFTQEPGRLNGISGESGQSNGINGEPGQSNGINGQGQLNGINGNPGQDIMSPGNAGAAVSEGALNASGLEHAEGLRNNGNGPDSSQIAFITARKQLEEARLAMTVEAAFEMLKNGIKIDIAPMEKLIAQLKGIESGYYRSLLTQGGYEASQANVDLFSDTAKKLEELKTMPAYAIGARNMQVRTVTELHQEGSQMQQSFQQANERYETMQTQVRKDLGDSIQKAFRNVDDILASIGQEATQANERAARILAYNRMEITPENVLKMKALDQQVQMVFRNMTPAVVREMIGRGINPLDMEFSELNRQAGQIQAEIQDTSTEKYSEYLYQLEMNKSITQEERDAYIGIYRLMNQVVDSDGAAVGALARHGTELTMRNLLTEVRSVRHGRIDAAVDDSFGELESGGYKDSIISQIESGYQSQCMKQALDTLTPGRLQSVMQKDGWEELSPEQFLQELTEAEAPKDRQAQEAYYQQKLDDLEKCAHYSKEVYQVLERYGLPNTVLNAMAVAGQMADRNNAYRWFFNLQPKRGTDTTKSMDDYMTETADGETQVDFDAIREELLNRFSEDIKKPEELAKAMEEIAECAEKCTSTMILENDVTCLDIRSLKLMNAQMSVNAKMARDEYFSMPVMIDGQVTNVTLKIVRGKTEKGLVNITLQTDNLGKIAAELKAKEKGITGYVAADSQKTCDLLKSMQEEFVKGLKMEDMEEPSVHFITGASLNLDEFAAKSGVSEKPQTEQLREVQTKELYQAAEGFIKVLKRIDSHS